MSNIVEFTLSRELKSEKLRNRFQNPVGAQGITLVQH